MLSPGDILNIRRLDGAQIVASYGAQARKRLFTPGGVPVIIAARNEEEDLPATLWSLMRSRRAVQTWVVVNGTTDATAERAEAMGAAVIECATPSKMAALHDAVATVTASRPRGPILFTDADTLVGSRWVETLERITRASSAPVVTVGNALFSHGDSFLADIARNVRKILISQRADRAGERGRAQGANLAIDFAGDEEALDSYLSIPHERFIGEEEEIVGRILAAGGEWRNAFGVHAVVVTRGDRFGLADLWRLRQDPDFTKRLARYAEYGEVKPYIVPAAGPATAQPLTQRTTAQPARRPA